MKKLERFLAIETVYRGFEFRSRLEAKWAVFFDLCGWKWSYEPFDLNGWIPDFAIGEEPTLVEVKPFFHKHEWKSATDKIIRAAGDRSRVVLLGADPTFFGVSSDPAPQVGWLLESHGLWADEIWSIVELCFGFTEVNDKLGMCTWSSGWDNVVWKTSGARANKDSRVWLDDGLCEEFLNQKWATACNQSKWIPLKKKSRNAEAG